MVNRLDIIDKQLELGDVKTITSGSGSVIKLIEMLFSTTTKAQYAPSDNRKGIPFILKMLILICHNTKVNLRKSLITPCVMKCKEECIGYY